MFGSSSAFGTTPAFGSSPVQAQPGAAFGQAASTPAFGAQSGFGTFSSSQTPASFGSPSLLGPGPGFTPAQPFGSSSSAPANPLFGASPGGIFGAQSSGSTLGSSASPAFGAAGTPLLGSTPAANDAGPGSRVVAYSKVTDVEVQSTGARGSIHCITAMPEYEKYSIAELRWQDYQRNDKGGPTPPATLSVQSPFGTPSASPAPFGSAASAAPFGSVPGASPFGAQAQSQSAFGAALPGFGAQSQSSFGSTAFGAQSQSAFGVSSSPFGAQSQPAFGVGTSPFGAQSQPAFGASPAPFGAPSQAAFGVSSSPFGAQSQPAFGVSPSPFGAQSQPAFGAQPQPAFGAQPQPAFGAQSQPAFGASPSPFGAQAQPGFGASSSAFAVQSQPAFGVSPSPFGAPSQPALGGSVSPFGVQSQPAFGSSPSPFGAQSQPALGPSMSPFGAQSQAQPAFGSAPSIFGSQSQPAFGAGPSAFGAQSQPAFGSTPSAFGAQSQPAFGSSASAFGAQSQLALGASPSPFGAQAQPAFGATPAAFGAQSQPAFGASPAFGAQSQPAFGSSSSAFAAQSQPAFGASMSAFGAQSQPALGSGSPLFGAQSQPAFGSSSSAIGAQSQPAIGTSSSIFGVQSQSAFGGSQPALGTQSQPAFGAGLSLGSASAAGLSTASSSAFGQSSSSPAIGAVGGTQASQSAFGAGIAFGSSQPAAVFGTPPALGSAAASGAGLSPAPAFGSSFGAGTGTGSGTQTTAAGLAMSTPTFGGGQLAGASTGTAFGTGLGAASQPSAGAGGFSSFGSVFGQQGSQPVVSPASTSAAPAEDRALIPLRVKSTPFDQQLTLYLKSVPRVRASLEIRADASATEESVRQLLAEVPEDPDSEADLFVKELRDGSSFTSSVLPKLSKPQYTCTPALSAMRQSLLLNPSYCQAVPDFTVSRGGVGSIQWPGQTNVEGLNLDGVVDIESMAVVVYGEQHCSLPVGTQLNKEAIVTLHNVRSRVKGFSGPETLDTYKQKLKRKVEAMGSEFVSYDAEADSLVFRVKHFTKYAVEDSDEEEEEQQISSEGGPAGSDDGMEVRLAGTVDVAQDGAGRSWIERRREMDFVHRIPEDMGLDADRLLGRREALLEEERQRAAVAAEEVLWAGEVPSAVQGAGSEDWDMFEEVEQERLQGLQQALQETSRAELFHEWRDGLMQEEARLVLEEQVQDSRAEGSNSAALVKDSLLPLRPSSISRSLPAQLVGGQGGQRVVYDRSFFLGKSFRIGWGPGNCVAVPEPDGVPQGPRPQVGLLQLPADDGKVCVEGQLACHLEFSSPREDRPWASSLNLDSSQLSEYCARNIKLLEDFASSSADSAERARGIEDKKSTWQLLEVLFSEHRREKEEGAAMAESLSSGMLVDTETFPLERGRDPLKLMRHRQRFSSWLQQAVQPLLQQDLDRVGGEYGSHLEEVLAYLSVNDSQRAADCAFDSGDVNLAVLLSGASAFMASRKSLALQAQQWEGDSVSGCIEDNRIAVVKLLSGNIEDCLFYSGKLLDWKRYLGMLLWYRLPAASALSTVLSEFKQLVDEGTAPAPVAAQAEEQKLLEAVQEREPEEEEEALLLAQDSTDSAPLDLKYSLMLLYLRSRSGELPFGFELEDMFMAKPAMTDLVDCTTSWLLHSALQSLGVVGPESLLPLSLNLSAQLQSQGLCQASLHVLCQLPGLPRAQHEQLLRQSLALTCPQWVKSETLKSALLTTLMLPPHWLHTEMGNWHMSSRMYWEALLSYELAEEWESAHNVFMAHFAGSWVNEGLFEEVVSRLSRFEPHWESIPGWVGGGHLILQGLTLIQGLEAHSRDSGDQQEVFGSWVELCSDLFTAVRLVFGQETCAEPAVPLPADLRRAYSKVVSRLSDLLMRAAGSSAVSPELTLQAQRVAAAAPVPDSGTDHAQAQSALSAFSHWLTTDCLL